MGLLLLGPAGAGQVAALAFAKAGIIVVYPLKDMRPTGKDLFRSAFSC